MGRPIKIVDKNRANNLINHFFKEVNLCGPRIIDAPRITDGITDEKKLCELFIPYQHSMNTFKDLIETMILPESTLFIETMEQSLLARQLSSKKSRLGKDGNHFNPLMMKALVNKKPNTEVKPTCKKGPKFDRETLKLKKATFCKGSNHLDLSNTNVKNIAIYYLKGQLSNKAEELMIHLKNKIRYDVEDLSCPKKLFDAKDISIQEVAMDINGTRKEWVAVVNLNDYD